MSVVNVGRWVLPFWYHFASCLCQVIILPCCPSFETRRTISGARESLSGFGYTSYGTQRLPIDICRMTNSSCNLTIDVCKSSSGTCQRFIDSCRLLPGTCLCFSGRCQFSSGACKSLFGGCRSSFCCLSSLPSSPP